MMAWCRRWCAGAALLAALSAHAISGNEQVRLAGEGLYDQLASRLAAENEGPAMSTADRHALCFAYSKLKDYGHLKDCLSALETQLRGKDRRTRLFGLDDGTPTVNLMRAEAAIDLGEFILARDEAQRAVDWFAKEQSDDRDILVEGLALTVIAQALAGQVAPANDTYQRLKAVDVSWPRYDSYAGAKRSAIAKAGVALGQWQDVLDAVAPQRSERFHVFMDDLLSGASARGKSNWVWQQLPRAYLLARATWGVGKLDDAAVEYDKLIAVPQLAFNGEIHWLALSDRGQVAEAQGDSKAAIGFYRRAIDVVEQQRSSIRTETSKIGFVGQRQQLYSRLIKLLLKDGVVSDAYEYVERSKSRALVDMLASRVNDTASVGAVADAAAGLDRIFVTERTLRQQTPVGADEVQVSASRHGELQSAVDDLRRIAPEAASLVSVDWLSADKLRGLLEPDELLLQYYLEGASGHVFAITREGMQVYAFDASTLDGTIRQLRDDLQNQSKTIDRTLRALYDLLLREPLRNATSKKLLIVPHGALHYLPFAPLTDGQQQLIDRWSLRTLPIATALQYLADRRTVAGHGVLLMGNPDLGNVDFDLPNAQLEVESLKGTLDGSTLLVRKAASETAFTRQAGQYRIVHVASHGVFDEAKPLESALMLSPDAGSDGRVTAGKLYAMRLRADLVALSACETGLGQALAGDEIVGLTRGFMYAGASSIIASLWNVDDLATSFLMQSFYKQLQKGVDKREALRQAQLETRAKFKHPFFWAPFFLVGRP